MQSRASRTIFISVACVIALAMVAPSAQATYDGQDGRIAFGAFDATDRTQADIWSVHTDGQSQHRLTDAPGRDICPAYSADGRQIAFCSDRTGAFEIWLMDANGNHERQVTDLGTYAVFPDFSPDGSQLVFSAEPAGGGNTDLWQVPTLGGAPSQLTHTPDMLEENPVWSPDGSTVLFVRIAGDFSSGQLWSMDVATGQETQLTFDPTFKDQTPDWSPDGTRIAYAADDDIWLMDADGTGQTNLTQSAAVEFGAAFSPEGRGSPSPAPAAPCHGRALRPDHPHRRLRAPCRCPDAWAVAGRARLAAARRWLSRWCRAERLAERGRCRNQSRIHAKGQTNEPSPQQCSSVIARADTPPGAAASSFLLWRSRGRPFAWASGSPPHRCPQEAERREG